MTTQPSETRLLEELRDMTEHWHDTIEQKKTLQKWYRKEYDVRFATGQDVLFEPYEFRSGRYSEIVDRTKGLLLVDVRYGVEAKGIGPNSRADAERAQDWLNHSQREIELAQGESFNNDLVFEVINYGYSGLAVLPDPNRWKDYPDMGDRPPKDYRKLLAEYGEMAPFPIAAYHCPVLTWRPMLAGRTVLKSFTVDQMTLAEVRYKFPEAKLPEETRSTKKYQYVTVIDDAWCVYMVCEGETEGLQGSAIYVKGWEHHMPVPKGTAPVALYEGMTTGEKDLKYRWKGYAEDIRGPIEGQDMLISAQVNRASASAIPTMKLRLDPNINPEMAEKLKETEFKMFGANIEIPGATWERIEFDQTHPSEEQAYAKFDQLINSRYPPSMRGEIAAESGYAYNLSAEYAKLIAKPIAQNMSKSDVDFGRLRFAAVGAIAAIAGHDIPVAVRRSKDDATEAIAVRWSEVKDYGPLITATREAELPTDEQSNLQAAGMAIDIGLPRKWAWERYAKTENPQEREDEALAERLMNEDPTLSANRVQAILRRMGALVDEEEGLTVDQAAQTAIQTPAMQRLIAAMGGPLMSTPQPTTPPYIPPAGEMGVPPGAPAPMPPQAVPAQHGVSVTRVRNPRAGQKSQPGGPRRKTGSVQVKA